MGQPRRSLEDVVTRLKDDDRAPLFAGAYAGRRVLVTGHTGFKGSWLTAWLLKLGATVCGYSIDVPSEPSLFEMAGFAGRIRHETGDVRDGAHFAEVLASFRPDFVFHLAAQAIVSQSYHDPLETLSTNVLGTACVLQALRAVDRPCVAIIITSDKAYENVEWPWGYRETDRLGGKDVYSASKGAAELAFHAFLFSFFNRPDLPVRLATTRAGNVIGGGDWAADRIVADCIRAWTEGGVVEIRSPAATRPWQHVLEPLSGYLALAARLANDPALHGESFNFGPRAEQNSTVVKLLQDLASVWGFDNPAKSFSIVGNVPFHEAGLLKLNCDKALLMLRWEPNLTYDECVRMTGDWYRDVLKGGRDALEVTTEQIVAYEASASERGRVWRRTEAAA
jgi:CDP-glucose 4,6-dehydratase